MLIFVSTLLVGCERSSPKQSSELSSAEKSANSTVDEAASDQRREGPTRRGQYFVELVPEPNPIPFQELFKLRVKVFESKARKTPAEDVELDQVRARMPAHDHGMKTSPEITRKGKGEFVVRGMRFHMRGDGEDGHWVVTIVVNGDEGIDEASFDYQCCTE